MSPARQLCWGGPGSFAARSPMATSAAASWVIPTANLHLPRDCRLRYGIYAVRIQIDGVWHDGVASFGSRPTFDDGAPRLETFVFDFSGDLYGKSVDVALVGHLRGEEKFDSLDALIAQMDRDSAKARALLAQTPPFLP